MGGWGESCKGGRRRKIKNGVEERGEKEGVNIVMSGICYVSENSHRENIVSVSGCPWRGLMKDYFLLIPRRTTKDTAIMAVRWCNKT